MTLADFYDGFLLLDSLHRKSEVSKTVIQMGTKWKFIQFKNERLKCINQGVVKCVHSDKEEEIVGSHFRRGLKSEE